ncbi:MAG TPA: phosphoglucosamine mutase [Luteibaculaceae bacterium]|nr:phosphoglucosamine mutase [Luteibaculaceae bacterium]
MTLIKSISGIRGTIGGRPNEALTPIDVVTYTAAFAQQRKSVFSGQKITLVVGRDARISGALIEQLVVATLQGMGVNVINLQLSTTPTVEVAVDQYKAHGGIILTASHNPAQWNALKLLNEKGEFISAAEGQALLDIAARREIHFASIDDLGTVVTDAQFLDKHLDLICADELVNVEAIKNAQFHIVVDGINSSGAIAVPALLKKLGVTQIEVLNGEPHGRFAHNPEPLAEHLKETSSAVIQSKAHMGIVVDPDVDRLAFISEDGSMFGEEYTLVAVADYVLTHRKGNTVSNLSSSRALRDVTRHHGGHYAASAVGEVNVVELMKSTQAVIGGEGNGGIIYPPLHYGRDALMGLALFLSYAAERKQSLTQLRSQLPTYFMAKKKIDLSPDLDVDALLSEVAKTYASEEINTIDGVKIDFSDGWVHLRKSNTEPIIRVYSEAPSTERADALADEVLEAIQKLSLS